MKTNVVFFMPGVSKRVSTHLFSMLAVDFRGFSTVLTNKAQVAYRFADFGDYGGQHPAETDIPTASIIDGCKLGQFFDILRAVRCAAKATQLWSHALTVAERLRLR